MKMLLIKKRNRHSVRSMLNSETARFSIRPASEDDLPKILEIERKCYRTAWSEDAFRVELTKPFSRFLVFTDDETDEVVAGYIVYWMMFDECHVLNVAIDPEWRGLGLAETLMRQAINDAVRKDLQRVFLEVRKSNAAATGLYQKLGFFIDHIKKNFYEDGEDAYFMALYLNRSNKF